MNTSQFMDKQIMDLSNSQNNSDFIDLENHIGSGKKEEIVPSYDFQPIRPIVASQQSNLDSSNVGGTRVWNSADSKSNTTAAGVDVGVGIRNYSSLESIEPATVISEKDHNVNNAALVSEIDRTMKKHADNLLHVLEGVSARISQLESRTRHLESSMDDLKISVGNNHEGTDGYLRQMENILREVQAGVQVIKDKQDIVEGQLQVSKVEQQSETQSAVQSDSLQLAASVAQQSRQQLHPPAIIQPQPNAPPTASQQNLPTSVQLPNQFPPNQIPYMPQRETYFAPVGQTQEHTNQQYQLPPPQQLQPLLPAPPQQQYQPPPHPPQYSQPPPPPQLHPSLPAVNPSQPQQPSLGHHPEEVPYPPPLNYPPSLRQPPHPPSGNPYGAPSHMYEPPSSRPNSGFSTAYGPTSGTNEPSYPYNGPPPQYGGGGPPSLGSGGSMKQQQQLSSAAAQGGGGGPNYPQLPTARILPHALPTASGVGGGSGSSGSGNRVPIDDVVDKVTGMGFTRDQVRATVRKLTENGQAVDLNVVLDKLMNDGGEGQPQRSWFGR
ncbi:hypothetical protein LOK49_LG04G03622 [Camellia lanceoleosa]|uniref:Uncharacterized protein n=1 Tax=Camellia lanceoleosa TaxID=1840588 RepID=A0ACC0I1V7_9ERIC|nr:hypothetical protein LOK49_LG04G03622 [Camellia lanceoleosa]